MPHAVLPPVLAPGPHPVAVLLRRGGALAWSTFAVVVITAAVLLSSVRILLPVVSEYRERVAQEVGRHLGRPVVVGALDADWWDLYPTLRLKDVRLLDPSGTTTLLELRELRVAVNPFSALIHWELAPAKLGIVGARLSVVRTGEGRYRVRGLQRPGLPAPDVAVLAWLGQQPRLSLLESELTYQDLASGAPPLQFTGVDLTLRNRGVEHRLAGSVALPGSLGQELSFVVDLRGDAGAPQDWSGRFYLRGRELQLPAWPSALFGGVEVYRGALDCQLWGDWRGTLLQRLQGSVQLRGLELAGHDGVPQSAAGNHTLRLGRLAGDVHWLRTDGGWRLQVEGLTLTRGAHSWPSGDLTLAYATPAEGERLISGRSDYLRLEDVSALARASTRLDGSLREALAGLNPHGVARGLRFSLHQRDAQWVDYSLGARVSGVGVEAWERMPALTGLNGRIQADERGGELQLANSKLTVNFDRLFRGPLGVESAGALRWRRDPDGWQLHSDNLVLRNTDLRARTHLLLNVPADGGAPLLDLQASFAVSDLGALPTYLPAHIMHPETVNWLDHALTAGRISDGRLLLRGRTTDFPFDQGEGAFVVRGSVEHAVLDFDPEWPRVEDISADVVFCGRSLAVRGRHGRIFGAEVGQADAAIPDLEHGVLLLAGVARGPAADLQRFVNESPLSGRLGPALDGVRTQGSAAVDLKLRQPLAPPGQEHPAQVNGGVTFSDATVALPGWQLALRHLTGRFGFTESSVSAAGVGAELFGRPVTIEAATVAPTAQERAVEFKFHGRGEIGALARQQPSALWALLDGESDFLATVAVPINRGQPLRLRVETALRGVAVDLPPPYGKAADDPAVLAVQGRFEPGGGATVDASYQGRVRGAFVLQRDAQDALKLVRGELRLGGARPVLPERDGLRLTGRMDRLSIGEWQDWLARVGAGGPDRGVPALREMDMRVAVLEGFGHTFRDMHLRGARVADAWKLAVDGKEVAGTLSIPQRASGNATLAMKLDRLLLRPGDKGAGGSEANPRRVPNLEVSAAQFRYGDADLGRLHLTARRRTDGLQVQTMTLEGDALHAQATGNWTVQPGGGQHSQLRLKLQSHDLGDLLTRFGYAGSIKDGETRAELDAGWPGSPAGFDLAALQGRLYVKIGKGRFRDIEPGAGRVFGLLSLQTLPRRLSLDFSDLFQKGFSFDSIEGHFQLEDGSAWTSDLTMRAPAARVALSGRTGLVDYDYDQLVTVTPSVSTSGLPLAGAIANPGVGAALLIAQTLFKSQIDDMIRYQYRVRGTWEHPQIERLDRAAAAEPARPGVQ